MCSHEWLKEGEWFQQRFLRRRSFLYGLRGCKLEWHIGVSMISLGSCQEERSVSPAIQHSGVMATGECRRFSLERRHPPRVHRLTPI